MESVRFDTEEEKTTLIDSYEKQGYTLIGESNLSEGNFLTFGTESEAETILLSETEKENIALKAQLAQTNADMQAFMDYNMTKQAEADAQLAQINSDFQSFLDFYFTP
jgi:hypothetical protein